MMAAASYYEMLNLQDHQYDPSLPPKLVKTAYKKALLRYHPDKTSLLRQENRVNANVTMDDLSLAYRTLSDAGRRAEYDKTLQSAVSDRSAAPRVHHTGLETVDLDTLDVDERTQVWTRSCRCGDRAGFVVTEAELEKNIEERELMVGCQGCSLWLRVLFSVDE